MQRCWAKEVMVRNAECALQTQPLQGHLCSQPLTFEFLLRKPVVEKHVSYQHHINPRDTPFLHTDTCCNTGSNLCRPGELGNPFFRAPQAPGMAGRHAAKRAVPLPTLLPRPGPERRPCLSLPLRPKYFPPSCKRMNKSSVCFVFLP